MQKLFSLFSNPSSLIPNPSCLFPNPSFLFPLAYFLIPLLLLSGCIDPDVLVDDVSYYWDKSRCDLRVGILSDTHLDPPYSDKIFRKALSYFAEREVDAIVIAGDVTQDGSLVQRRGFRKIWDNVFPDGRRRDGGSVALVVVTGESDNEKVYEELTGRPYASVFSQDVKGYAFIGQHWEDAAFKRLPAFLQGAGGKGLDPAKPLFYLQHAHLRDTCYGTDAAGDSDCGDSAKALAAYPNAVAFSGHSHYPLTDERSIWQGAFTSVGAASLRYSCIYSSANCEDAWSTGKDAARRNAEKAMPMLTPDLGTRQGLLVRVYADRIVYRRRDFLSDQSLGADWVQPLVKTAGKRPYAFAEHAKRFRAPQFAADAKLTFAAVQAKNRGGKDVPAVLKPCVRVDIPPVVPNPQGRVFIYDLSVSSASGETVERRVTAKGFNRSLEHADAKAVTPCVLALDSLPKGPLKFRVTPVNSFGAAGLPIRGTFVVNSSACGAERK